MTMTQKEIIEEAAALIWLNHGEKKKNSQRFKYISKKRKQPFLTTAKEVIELMEYG